MMVQKISVTPAVFSLSKNSLKSLVTFMYNYCWMETNGVLIKM